MACAEFNLDDRAFERATVGLMDPLQILAVLEDSAVDDNTILNPHPAQQPRLDTPQQLPHMHDSVNLDFIMAGASNLKAFQELEAYIYGEPESGSEIDVPEESEDYDESDVSVENDAMDVIPDVARDQ